MDAAPSAGRWRWRGGACLHSAQVAHDLVELLAVHVAVLDRRLDGLLEQRLPKNAITHTVIEWPCLGSWVHSNSITCPKITNAMMVQMLDRVVWPRGPRSLICVPASLPPTTMEAPNMDTCPTRLVIEAWWGSEPLAFAGKLQPRRLIN
jgi:hypothetical protein